MSGGDVAFIGLVAGVMAVLVIIDSQVRKRRRKKKATWQVVPICRTCWSKEHPTVGAVGVEGAGVPAERCYSCGFITLSGIYVRRMV